MDSDTEEAGAPLPPPPPLLKSRLLLFLSLKKKSRRTHTNHGQKGYGNVQPLRFHQLKKKKTTNQKKPKPNQKAHPPLAASAALGKFPLAIAAVKMADFLLKFTYLSLK